MSQNKLKLEVGKKYLDSTGNRVEILYKSSYDEVNDYLGVIDFGDHTGTDWYREDGECALVESLVSEIRELEFWNEALPAVLLSESNAVRIKAEEQDEVSREPKYGTGQKFKNFDSRILTISHVHYVISSDDVVYTIDGLNNRFLYYEEGIDENVSSGKWIPFTYAIKHLQESAQAYLEILEEGIDYTQIDNSVALIEYEGGPLHGDGATCSHEYLDWGMAVKYCRHCGNKQKI